VVSRENVEIVERFLERWNTTGELPLAEIDPDAVFVIDPRSFVAGTYEGYEGIRTLERLTAEVFEEFRWEADEVIEVGEAVVAVGRIRARGLPSGAVGTQPSALVLQIRAGRIAAYRSYFSREEALEAAALRDRR
jgi:ketosteroid isomerase-like protein